MCGIVGYIGKSHCKDLVLGGMQRLEYRGYDSAGFVFVNEKAACLSYLKRTGTVANLAKELSVFDEDGFSGIGHTRWATHGVVNEANAHPHFNCKGNIALVHNGIIEEHESLRNELIAQGHKFLSKTDSEVLVHYFSSLFDIYKSVKKATIELVKKIKGAYSIVVLIEELPDQLLVIRHNSPLVLGRQKKGFFVASDVIAFSDKVDEFAFMPEDSIAVINKNSIQLLDFSGKSLLPVWQESNLAFVDVSKDGFEHFMLKEIYEQKKVIDKIVNFYRLVGTDSKLSASDDLGNALKYQLDIEYQDRIWQQLGLSLKTVKNLKKINLIAAGTSWHACKIGQFFFESISNIQTSVYLASEFCYMPFFKEKDSIFIFLSQSGETADTLQALRLVKSHNVPTVVITNVPSSTMVQESSGFLPMQAGPEISVASTKAFSAQQSILFILANRIALELEKITLQEMKSAEEDLFMVSQVLEMAIENYKWEISNGLAEKYSAYDKYIFLGRHISYPMAMEAALKLKEISYIFAQSYPAGELKHGPIALIDETTPVVLFSALDEIIYKKLLSNAQEVKARSGHLVVFAFEGQNELIGLADYAFVLPKVNPLLAPLACTGVMQFFVYEITKRLGRPIDKPRNLAKSVTVE